MTAASAPHRGPLLSLQVLRAAAAGLVLAHHAAHDADAIAARGGGAPLALDRFVDLGFGVHVFFMVSGFIMLRTARGFGSAHGAKIFALRRAARVVPLYWLLTTLVLLGTAFAPGLLDTPPGGIAWTLGSYLFIPIARGHGAINPVLGQGWTLDYEMFFYALFAAALLLPRRLALPSLAAALLALVGLGRIAKPHTAAFAVWTDGLLLEFLFGLAVGFAAERGLRLAPLAATAAALTGLALWAAMGPATHRFDAAAPWLREGFPAALLVAGCVLGPRWPAGRVTLALALLGDASYSLYLSHPFVVRPLRAAWLGHVPAGVPPILFFLLASAAACAAALTLHRWIERPVTEALGRRIGAGGAPSRPILPEVAQAVRRG